MDVYLGRQPILDRGWNIAGYELLFRSSPANLCDSTDDVSATTQVIANAVLAVGLDRLLGGKPAFIRFDQTLLLGDWSTLLPPDKVVIEILEPSRPPARCSAFAINCTRPVMPWRSTTVWTMGGPGRFAPFVDILKVDFQRTSPADQERIIRRYQKFNLGMVAKKVETESEFRAASQLGYNLLSGIFFRQTSPPFCIHHGCPHPR